MMLGDILPALEKADTRAFLFINQALYWRPLADLTFWLANDKLLLGLILAGIAVYFWKRGGRAALILSVWSGLALLFSNLLHNEVLKPLFSRPRPFLALADVHLSAHLKDLSAVSYSFPSTHASSAAALAMVAVHLDPALKMPVWLFALCVGWGAIYSGGHYPVDVAAGYAVGIGVGWVLIQAIQAWPFAKMNRKEHKGKKSSKPQ